MNMTVTHGLLAAITTSMLMLACGGSKREPAPPQPASSGAQAHGEAGGMGGMCPMAEGTKITAEDTQDGVAMSFTTTGDVAQLRQRVHHMADMHEHMMQGGMMGSGQMMGSGHMMMTRVPSTARAEDIDGGARIVLTPKDPAQLADLRARVHEHASQMASGHCPMMEHHG